MGARGIRVATKIPLIGANAEQARGARRKAKILIIAAVPFDTHDDKKSIVYLPDRQRKRIGVARSGKAGKDSVLIGGGPTGG